MIRKTTLTLAALLMSTTAYAGQELNIKTGVEQDGTALESSATVDSTNETLNIKAGDPGDDVSASEIESGGEAGAETGLDIKSDGDTNDVNMSATSSASASLDGESEVNIRSDQEQDGSMVSGAEGTGSENETSVRIDTEGQVETETNVSGDVPVSGDAGPEGDATAGGTLENDG